MVNSDVPSGSQPYGGRLGRTRWERIHYTLPSGTRISVKVYTSVNAATDAELADALRRGELNVVRDPTTRESFPVNMPVIYHDPDSAIFALMIPDALRHREFAERAAVLERLALDTDPAVPSYVAEFQTVFGGAALHAITEPATDQIAANDLVEAADATQVTRLADNDIDAWLRSAKPAMATVSKGLGARIAFRDDRDLLETLQSEPVTVALQLHRLTSYALITLCVTPTEDATASVDVHLDPANGEHRAVLAALGVEFEFVLDLYTTDGNVFGRRSVRADLRENASAVLEAADAHLRRIPATSRSLPQAIAEIAQPNYDRHGTSHAESKEWQEHKLSSLGRPMDVRRALAIAARFSKTSRTEYLVFTLGFPVEKWIRLRRHAIKRGIELGLWLGDRLVDVAVKEGMVTSKKELLGTLLGNFAELVRTEGHGLSAPVVTDNWNDLARVAKALRVPLPPSPIQEASRLRTISGTIDPSSPGHEKELPGDPARIEAGRLGDIGEIFDGVGSMTRSQACEVLAKLTGNGATAHPYWLRGLTSRKGFIRHGCALALGIANRPGAAEALSDLLVNEPTEIWREVAWALGCIGKTAVAPTLKRGRSGDEAEERVAWALASIAARDDGSVALLDALSRGSDTLSAGVARRAKELLSRARRESQEAFGLSAPVEDTVNRGFTRAFIRSAGVTANPEALADRPDESAPAILLDESDLIEADSDEHLLQTAGGNSE